MKGGKEEGDENGFDAGKMTYQCDGTLGAGGPDPVDCEKLAWSGLYASSGDSKGGSGNGFKLDANAEVKLLSGVPRFWSEGRPLFHFLLLPETMSKDYHPKLSLFHVHMLVCPITLRWKKSKQRRDR